MDWYHGSVNYFNKYELPKAFENNFGTDMGFDLYFTDNVDRA